MLNCGWRACQGEQVHRSRLRVRFVMVWGGKCAWDAGCDRVSGGRQWPASRWGVAAQGCLGSTCLRCAEGSTCPRIGCTAVTVWQPLGWEWRGTAYVSGWKLRVDQSPKLWFIACWALQVLDLPGYSRTDLDPDAWSVRHFLAGPSCFDERDMVSHVSWLYSAAVGLQPSFRTQHGCLGCALCMPTMTYGSSEPRQQAHTWLLPCHGCIHSNKRRAGLHHQMRTKHVAKEHLRLCAPW